MTSGKMVRKKFVSCFINPTILQIATYGRRVEERAEEDNSDKDHYRPIDRLIGM